MHGNIKWATGYAFIYKKYYFENLNQKMLKFATSYFFSVIISDPIYILGPSNYIVQYCWLRKFHRDKPLKYK